MIPPVRHIQSEPRPKGVGSLILADRNGRNLSFFLAEA